MSAFRVHYYIAYNHWETLNDQSRPKLYFVQQEAETTQNEFHFMREVHCNGLLNLRRAGGGCEQAIKARCGCMGKIHIITTHTHISLPVRGKKNFYVRLAVLQGHILIADLSEMYISL